MKKYLSGLVALLLAVAVSAFTSKPIDDAGANSTYYWYIVDPVTFETVELAFGHTKYSEAAAAGMLSECDDENPLTEPCLSGFDNDDEIDQPLPNDEGRIVRKKDN